MACIHYKFKSSLDYNSVTFDGLHLSLTDLKKAISLQKRLKPGEFDLEIVNAQTGNVYKKNDELIAKNTSVIVSRVPVIKSSASSTQKSWEAFKQECAKNKEKERQISLEKLNKAPDLAVAPASEMDKIKAVIDMSTIGFEQSNFGKQSGVTPEYYVCRKCGQKGHFLSNCPNNNTEDRIIEPRYKRTTGIPATMLTIVDDPLHPGALLTSAGLFAVPTVDVEGYNNNKKDRPPFATEETKKISKRHIPDELNCIICNDICVDAAIAPCCGTSFCDDCLREELLESELHQCPSCKKTNVSPDSIVANKNMRLAVNKFLNDTGYTKEGKKPRSRKNSTCGDATLPGEDLSINNQPLADSLTQSSSSTTEVISQAVTTTSSVIENPEPVSSTQPAVSDSQVSSSKPHDNSDNKSRSFYGHSRPYQRSYEHSRYRGSGGHRFPYFNKPWRYLIFLFVFP